MCNENINTRDCKCIGEILKVILILQNNACGPDTCLDTCDKPSLGCGAPILCNTRPFMLYTCSGQEFAFPTDKNSVETSNPECKKTSPVFRIEKLEDCCATCRVLVPNNSSFSAEPFAATDSFFTINLGCCCAIKCLKDCYVEL